MNFLGGELFSIGVGDAVGEGAGDLIADGFGDGIADGDGAEFGDAVGDATGFGLADGDGVLDGDGIADGDGAEFGDAVGEGAGDLIADGFGAGIGAVSFAGFFITCEFAIGNWFCLAGSFLDKFCDKTFWLIIFFSKSLPLIKVDCCGIFCELEFLFLSNWELLFFVNLSL